MKKLLPIAAFAFLSHITYAQSIDVITGNYSTDLVYAIHGKAPVKYENIKKGTPYFISDWLPATVILFDGRQFNNVMSKIDLLEHRFIYLNNGVEYTAESKIREVIFNDSLNGKKYHFIHDSAFPNPVQKGDNGWYLVLTSGNVSAFMYIIKKIEESREYNSAITNRNIENSEKYFISYKNLLIPVKRLKDIPDILRDRQGELNAYLNKEGMNKVTGESLGKLISYYNSFGK
ncbi:hypothetical protein OCK74_14575 [Chitinophagaceae bacterium LB-8]|uniref:Uncharacterized protein n=1 Tax=Paraflavisolibacter caeni TaxID=2982496 RepID=A0A9X3BG55_9BACT|nr:hypothetical protein [Paraflavisolibacter caeni]MCU7550344.1 hypothetical protein [Paraflavisolibacter caeni]